MDINGKIIELLGGLPGRLGRGCAIAVFCLAFTAFLLAGAKKSFALCSDEFAALVIDGKTKNVLHQVRSEELKYPASLIKVMTLYLTFEALENDKLSMDQKLVVSERAAGQPRLNLDLKAGDIITVREAILSLIVKSANDVSVVLGEALAGNEWRFANMMTDKARELGMERSYFRNASGLPDWAQVTTAYDMARLALAIKNNFPQYYPLFSSTKFTYNDKLYKTHNYVLLDYDGAEGMKTGFTNASGFNLIAVASKNGEQVVSVLMSCSTKDMRDGYTQTLLDKGFEEIKKRRSVMLAKPKAKDDIGGIGNVAINYDRSKKQGIAYDSFLRGKF